MSGTWNADQVAGDSSGKGGHTPVLAKVFITLFLLFIAVLVAIFIVLSLAYRSGECFGTGAGAF